MAIFSSKKNTSGGEKKVGAKKAAAKTERALKPGSIRIDEAKGGEKRSAIIITPRITERSSLITEDGGYTFNIISRAGKNEVKKAIKEMYGVTPIKVNIVNMKQKAVWVRGKYGLAGGGKKAIVFLPEGQKIEFV